MHLEPASIPTVPACGRLKDKVALITGAAQGIGYATAELFVAEGAKVAIVDVDAEKAKSAAQKLDGGMGVCMGMACDVTKADDAHNAVKTVLDAWKKLDILVNNAGVTKDNLLALMSEADWDFVLDINLKGVFNVSKAAIRPMMKAHYGRVVNIASIVGEEGNAGQANYAASKGGVIALTKTLAREFASRRITVNAVAPGFIHTRMTEAMTEEAKQKLFQKIFLGRMGEPVEVARAVLFLSSDESSYVTGHVLNVNGGGYM